MVWFLWIRDLLRVQLGGSVSGKLSSWVYSHDKAKDSASSFSSMVVGGFSYSLMF